MNRRRWLTGWCRGGSVALCWRWHGRRSISERAHGWRYRWRCFRSARDLSLSPSFNATSRAFFEAQRCRFEENLMPENEVSVTGISMRNLRTLCVCCPIDRQPSPNLSRLRIPKFDSVRLGALDGQRLHPPRPPTLRRDYWRTWLEWG